MTSGATYISPPVITDPDTLAANTLAYLTANIPGLVHSEGDLWSWLAAAVAREVAVARDLASAVPIAIWRYYGSSILGLPPLAAAYATMPVTWTVVDTAGYTIRAGTLVGWALTGSTLIGFRTTADVIIAPGANTGAGTVQATAAGAAANVCGPGALTLIDSLSFVASVTATAQAAGGADAETDIDYVNRLVADAQTLGPKPVTAADYAILTRNVAGVHRALVLDGYNATLATSGNERTVGIFALDVNGNAVGSTVNTAIVAYFSTLREVGFVVTTGAPTYTSVAIAYTVQAAGGFDVASLEASVAQALAAVISPAGWAGGGSNPPTWNAGEATVRYLDIAAVIRQVFGVAHLEALTLNGGTADVVLPGAAPLPQLGTITPTVLP